MQVFPFWQHHFGHPFPNRQRNEVALKYQKIIADEMKKRQSMATGGDRRSENYKNQGMTKRSDVEKLNPTTARKELAKIAGTSEGKGSNVSLHPS